MSHKNPKFVKTHIRIFDEDGDIVLATNTDIDAYDLSHKILDLIEETDKEHEYGSKDIVDGYQLST